MKRILEKWPAFLILIPVFILIHLEKSYHFIIRYSLVYKEVLIILLMPFILYLFSRIIFKNAYKAIVFSFVLLFFFYFTGEIKDFLMDISPGNNFASYRILMPLILIVIITSGYLIAKAKNFTRLILYINCLFILGIAGDLAIMLFTRKDKPPFEEKIISSPVCNECNKPDIYYIIFDSYSSSTILKSELSFDNTQQEAFLEEHGFFIMDNSKSNYNLTPYCIASTFGLNYLPGVDTTKKHYIRDYISTIRLAYYNPLFPFFEKQGYSIYNHSLFDFEDHPSSIPSFDIWRIDKIYQQYNIVRKMYNETGWNFPGWMKISFGKDPDEKYIDNRIIHDNTAISHLYQTVQTSSDKPKLVYDHIFLPHSPYYFDSSGSRIRPQELMTPEEDKKAYIQQLIYANKLMQDIIRKLLSESRPKIIIIQGDHGYRFFDYTKKNEEFPNLNAVYFSPGLNININTRDTFAGVNTFRYIINALFSQQLPLLENRSYFLKYQ